MRLIRGRKFPYGDLGFGSGFVGKRKKIFGLPELVISISQNVVFFFFHMIEFQNPSCGDGNVAYSINFEFSILETTRVAINEMSCRV